MTDRFSHAAEQPQPFHDLMDIGSENKNVTDHSNVHNSSSGTHAIKKEEGVKDVNASEVAAETSVSTHGNENITDHSNVQNSSGTHAKKIKQEEGVEDVNASEVATDASVSTHGNAHVNHLTAIACIKMEDNAEGAQHNEIDDAATEDKEDNKKEYAVEDVTEVDVDDASTEDTQDNEIEDCVEKEIELEVAAASTDVSTSRNDGTNVPTADVPIKMEDNTEDEYAFTDYVDNSNNGLDCTCLKQEDENHTDDEISPGDTDLTNDNKGNDGGSTTSTFRVPVPIKTEGEEEEDTESPYTSMNTNMTVDDESTKSPPKKRRKNADVDNLRPFNGPGMDPIYNSDPTNNIPRHGQKREIRNLQPFNNQGKNDPTF
jgi:hypothetical protein